MTAAVPHAEVRAAVSAALGQGRLPHALLLVGPAGLGQDELARWIVRARWCSAEDAPCDLCGPCRKVLTGNHPDLTLIERDPPPERDPEGHGSKHEITVDQIRHDLVGALSLSAVEGAGRAVILDEADALNVEAQNALLKTLEEPPPGTLLVLVASRPEALLDTVRSRCQEHRLRPLDAAGLAAAVGGDAGPWAGLAGGRPGRWRELQSLDVGAVIAAADGLLCGRLRGVDFANAMRQAVAAAGEATPPLDEAAARRIVLEVLHARLADLVALAGGAAADAARTPAPAELGAMGGPDRLLAAERALLEASMDLRRHVPAAVSWTALADAWAAGVGVYGQPPHET